MQMSLEIDNNFFPHFKVLIDSFVRDQKVSIVEEGTYDHAAYAPESTIISSVQEVQRRAAEAEKRIANGHGVSDAEYEERMNRFFQEELGITR